MSICAKSIIHSDAQIHGTALTKTLDSRNLNEFKTRFDQWRTEDISQQM